MKLIVQKPTKIKKTNKYLYINDLAVIVLPLEQLLDYHFSSYLKLISGTICYIVQQYWYSFLK